MHSHPSMSSSLVLPPALYALEAYMGLRLLFVIGKHFTADLTLLFSAFLYYSVVRLNGRLAGVLQPPQLIEGPMALPVPSVVSEVSLQYTVDLNQAPAKRSMGGETAVLDGGEVNAEITTSPQPYALAADADAVLARHRSSSIPFPHTDTEPSSTSTTDTPLFEAYFFDATEEVIQPIFMPCSVVGMLATLSRVGSESSENAFPQLRDNIQDTGDIGFLGIVDHGSDSTDLSPFGTGPVPSPAELATVPKTATTAESHEPSIGSPEALLLASPALPRQESCDIQDDLQTHLLFTSSSAAYGGTGHLGLEVAPTDPSVTSSTGMALNSNFEWPSGTYTMQASDEYMEDVGNEPVTNTSDQRCSLLEDLEITCDAVEQQADPPVPAALMTGVSYFESDEHPSSFIDYGFLPAHVSAAEYITPKIDNTEYPSFSFYDVDYLFGDVDMDTDISTVSLGGGTELTPEAETEDMWTRGLCLPVPSSRPENLDIMMGTYTPISPTPMLGPPIIGCLGGGLSQMLSGKSNVLADMRSGQTLASLATEVISFTDATLPVPVASRHDLFTSFGHLARGIKSADSHSKPRGIRPALGEIVVNRVRKIGVDSLREVPNQVPSSSARNPQARLVAKTFTTPLDENRSTPTKKKNVRFVSRVMVEEIDASDAAEDTHGEANSSRSAPLIVTASVTAAPDYLPSTDAPSESMDMTTVASRAIAGGKRAARSPFRPSAPSTFAFSSMPQDDAETERNLIIVSRAVNAVAVTDAVVEGLLALQLPSVRDSDEDGPQGDVESEREGGVEEGQAATNDMASDSTESCSDRRFAGSEQVAPSGFGQELSGYFLEAPQGELQPNAARQTAQIFHVPEEAPDTSLIEDLEKMLEQLDIAKKEDAERKAEEVAEALVAMSQAPGNTDPRNCAVGQPRRIAGGKRVAIFNQRQANDAAEALMALSYAPAPGVEAVGTVAQVDTVTAVDIPPRRIAGSKRVATSMFRPQLPIVDVAAVRSAVANYQDPPRKEWWDDFEEDPVLNAELEAAFTELEREEEEERSQMETASDENASS